MNYMDSVIFSQNDYFIEKNKSLIDEDFNPEGIISATDFRLNEENAIKNFNQFGNGALNHKINIAVKQNSQFINSIEYG